MFHALVQDRDKAMQTKPDSSGELSRPAKKVCDPGTRRLGLPIVPPIAARPDFSPPAAFSIDTAIELREAL
jgi:hypothetical protein